MIDKYAAKRAELKAAGDLLLPPNSSLAAAGPLLGKRSRSVDYMRQVWLKIPSNFPRTCIKGEIPGVTKSSWWEIHMTMIATDPIADVVTRIRQRCCGE